MRKTKMTKDLTVQEPGQLPGFLKDKVRESAGMGVSSRAEDNLIPLIYILQSNSPQVDERDPEYVEGAKPGDIWLRNSGLPAIKGEVGLVFQPCYFSIDWPEWKPNRAGFVGRHLTQPPEAVWTNTPTPQDPDRMSWVMPNGNTVQETRYHPGYVYLPGGRVMPFVIPLTSTGHTVSKNWMTLMNGKMDQGVVTASFMSKYRLKTKMKVNAFGKFFVFSISDEGWITTDEEYQRGFALHASFEAGEKGIEAPVDEGHSSSNAAASDSAAM